MIFQIMSQLLNKIIDSESYNNLLAERDIRLILRNFQQYRTATKLEGNTILMRPDKDEFLSSAKKLGLDQRPHVVEIANKLKDKDYYIRFEH